MGGQKNAGTKRGDEEEEGERGTRERLLLLAAVVEEEGTGRRHPAEQPGHRGQGKGVAQAHVPGCVQAIVVKIWPPPEE